MDKTFNKNSGELIYKETFDQCLFYLIISSHIQRKFMLGKIMQVVLPSLGNSCPSWWWMNVYKANAIKNWAPCCIFLPWNSSTVMTIEVILWPFKPISVTGHEKARTVGVNLTLFGSLFAYECNLPLPVAREGVCLDMKMIQWAPILLAFHSRHHFFLVMNLYKISFMYVWGNMEFVL